MIEFKLNEKEEAAANKFMKKHQHPEVNKGAIGGHIHFLFTPTYIGDACTLHCSVCDEKENITDYDCW